jgi:hypothetical protein
VQQITGADGGGVAGGLQARFDVVDHAEIDGETGHGNQDERPDQRHVDNGKTFFALPVSSHP